MAKVLTVKVAVSHTSYSFDMLFTYKVPLQMVGSVEKGKRVVVPFGRNNSHRIGVIFAVQERESEWIREKNIKPIIGVADQTPVLNDELIELAKWLCENTFCTYFEAVKAILPSGLHLRLKETYKLSKKYDDASLDEREKNFLIFLKNAKTSLELDTLIHRELDADKSKKSIVNSLVEKCILQKNCDVKQNTDAKTQKMVRLTSGYLENPDDYKITPKQKLIADMLSYDVSYALSEICYVCGVTSAVANTMQKNGIIEVYEKRVMRDIDNADSEENIADLVLNECQKKAYTEINFVMQKDKADCFLLHGVTGSGKTSVFKKLIADAIEAGKQALLLLPEISLTPQIVAQFRRLFGDIVTVIHSGLSMGQRLDSFQRIEKNEAKIVIGTRSAVFAPFVNLGLIIMDEEGERTYKSESAPRYNTIDVVKQRARYHNAVIVLASATPSIESYYLASKDIYHLLEMNERYSEFELPQVNVIDMTQEVTYGIDLKFSETLVNEVNENLRRCEQTILLLNRRGYHTMVSCMSCRQPVFCPNCSVPMTYHKKNNRLMCHMCGEMQEVPRKCPSCGSDSLRMTGFGTQKLEEQIQELFPKARILRMDADTVFSRDSYEKNIKDFEEGKYDILVGTQMIGKGLNFPEVTLVGIVSVDKSLYSGDFRSYERTFSLITQVVGRSGRSEKKGRAVLQTYIPDHYVIKLAAKQDYKAFYNEEIETRKMSILPPLCDLCIIGLSGENELAVRDAAFELLEYIKKTFQNRKGEKFPIRVLGPALCTYGKINKKYRYRILIKSKNTSIFRDFIRDILKNGTKTKKFARISVYADMNGDAGI